MEKEILLVQFRDDVSLEHEVNCFKKKLPNHKIKFIRPILDEHKYDVEKLLENTALVILGGSGQYHLSQKHPNILRALSEERTKPLLDYILEKDFPTLGICFGHQIICEKLGGKVEPIPEQAEHGTIEVFQTIAGKQDKIFGTLPQTFLVQESHKECVSQLPANADLVVLAHGKKCQIQATRYKQNIYTVQFHPELSPDDIEYRWTLYPEYLQNHDVSEIRNSFRESPEATEILERLYDRTNIS